MTQSRRCLRRAAAVLTFFVGLGLVAPPAGFAATDAAENLRIDLEGASDTISMSFDGALLKDVLLLFSQQSGLNFIASSDVESKKVTVYFENVSPQDALDSIVAANGLEYTKKPGSDIYLVTSAGKGTGAATLVTKVIRLKYMRLSDSPLDVGGAVTISSLTESAAVSSTGSSSGGGTTSSSGSGSADKGVDKLVANLLSSSGKLTKDTATNSLIITDTAESIEAIQKVLAEMDVPPSQVILEVHIMEVDKSIGADIGLEWGGTNGALGSFAGGKRTTQFPITWNARQAQQIVGPDDVGTGDPEDPSLFSQMSFGTVDASNFAATLHYIESDSKTRILARPRVLTQNNEAAEIKLVTNQTIGVTTSTATVGNAAATTTPERSDVGVVMRMTPQINEDGSVLLFVQPAVSTAAVSTFNSQFQDVTTRSVRTMARVKNNETLVIGGLIDSNDTTAQRKMPILGDLPGLGRLFRYDATDNVDRELVVFVTPHIVYGASSLGKRSATAVGEDASLRHVLSEFMDKEMDRYAGQFQDYESREQAFFTPDQQFIRDTEKRLSNPLVDKQMTQALDALSPQLIDTQMTQALDTFNTKKYRSG